MIEPVDNDDDDDDVVGQKRRPQTATVILPITYGSAKSRLGAVKARDAPAVVTTTSSEATDVRRTLRIGRVIVAKRPATTATSDDDNSNDIDTKSEVTSTTTLSGVARPEVKKRLMSSATTPADGGGKAARRQPRIQLYRPPAAAKKHVTMETAGDSGSNSSVAPPRGIKQSRPYSTVTVLPSVILSLSSDI